MIKDSQIVRKRRMANSPCSEGCLAALRTLTLQCRHGRARAWLEHRGLPLEEEEG